MSKKWERLSEIFAFRIRPSLLKDIERVAEIEGEPPARLVRRVVESFVRERLRNESN